MNPRYKVVENSSQIKFTEQVEFWLSKGWKLVGGVYVSQGTTYTLYYQAMSLGVQE